MTGEDVKAAWIANLKTKPQIIALVTPEEIREVEWQSTDFVYPNIRVSVEFRPSLNRCGPDDADVEIIAFSEQKSSKQSAHIASVIEQLYHGTNFKQNGFFFSTVIVRKVEKPMRSVFAWETRVNIFCQGV